MNITENAKASAAHNRQMLSGNQNQINAGGINKRFDVFNYRQSARFGQPIKCQKCASDYMKYSVSGFCQDCIQRVEFVNREHPHIAHDVRNQNREATR